MNGISVWNTIPTAPYPPAGFELQGSNTECADTSGSMETR